MFVFNISNPITLILMLLATILLVFLAHEIKKSAVAAVVLLVYLGILVMHVIQLNTLSEEFAYLSSELNRCLVFDFAFLAISFFAYLWTDDIEAKDKNKKSISNSLDWFWKKV